MGTLIFLVLSGIVLAALVRGVSRGTRESQTTSARGERRPRSTRRLDAFGERSSHPVFPTPKPRSPLAVARAGDERWIAPGREVSIAGTAIAGGMLYVGGDLPPIGSWHEREPALIDPTLPISRIAARDGSGMTYWPVYADIPAECRAGYIEWLATGRSDPAAYIGYVFLFFYGLERRLLFELRELPERRNEAPQLIAEVERLLSIYRGSGSFKRYATALLQSAHALWAHGTAHERAPLFASGRGELPTDVRLAIAQLVAAGKPVPRHWALAWVIGHPETRLRTPAKRCPEEFRELFFRRFDHRLGDGLSVKPGKRRLVLTYTPASASFGKQIEIACGDLPDIAPLSKPVRMLQELADAACAELESYSRFIGRAPDQAGSLQALALLPPELAQSRHSAGAQGIRQWINTVLDDTDCALTAASDVIQHWPCDGTDRLRKNELGAFARVLESLDCGIEPDPRYGGADVPIGQSVALFRLHGEPLAAPSASYRAASLLIHLATAVAASDGDISEQEEQHLESHLERSMGLTPAEVRRLRAQLRWLLSAERGLTGLKRRLAEIDERGRHQLAQFAVAIAAADGGVDSKEIKILGKIYRLLGFDPDQAFADVHSLRADQRWVPARQPVTVRPHEDVAVEHAIPPRTDGAAPPEPTRFHLDMDRVERTLAETALVSSVLADVFVDDLPELASIAPREIASVAGLDAAHGQLLQQLKGRMEISREEFEELAEALGLLSDGAFECLNEAAFEHSGQPLLEGDDPISVDSDTLGELMR